MDINPNDNWQNNLNNYNNQDEERKKDIYQIILSKLNKNKNIINNNINNVEEEYEKDLINKKINEEKLFDQQRDILYYQNELENQPSIINFLIKQYKKQKQLYKSKETKELNTPKKEIKKPKTSKNKIANKKKVIPYLNKNKGLFDPYLIQKELDYESKIKKEREKKKKKILDYEKSKNRKKLEKDINKRIINYVIPKMNPLIKSQNFDKKIIKKKDEDSIKHFMQMPKPKIQKKLAENFGFNPKKYDSIINSLLNEINKIKNERKRENEIFKKQLQLYTKDNVDKYNNYYEFIYKRQQLNYDDKFKNLKKNNGIKNKPTKGQIINELMKKYFGKNSKGSKGNKIDNINDNQLMKETKIFERNIENNSNKDKGKVLNKNNINNINDLLNTNQKNINKINFDDLDKLLSAENLTFQDKINILSELNKKLDNYYKDMPEFFGQVQSSLDKLCEGGRNDFGKEFNKVPYIAMASKAAFQVIQTNNHQIIENIIEELLYDLTYDLNIIDQKKKKLSEKKQLVKELDKVQNNINVNLPKDENEIIQKLNIFLKQKEEELKNKINNNNNYNKKNLVIIKYLGELAGDFISERYKYKDEFRNYMIFKGSFYHEDIFEIYDQFVEEEGDNIANKIVDNYIEELHRQAQKMANNEINYIEEK